MIREKLIAFFRAEIDAEEQWGFPRLNRIPESFLQDRLNHYRELSDAEKDRYKDCSATFAAASHTFVVDTPTIDHTKHPYFGHWRTFKKTVLDNPNLRNVPLFRAMIQQYKIDKHRGVPSSVTDAQFALACSIRPVELPERRRRVRAVLKQFGLVKVDKLGLYRCHHSGKDFSVYVDFGGRHAQLRYAVSFPEFKDRHSLIQFGFERALGFGFGHWNFIVEENVDEVFQLFAEVVAYSAELPDRIRNAVRQ
jgi:hypothetical protein